MVGGRRAQIKLDDAGSFISAPDPNAVVLLANAYIGVRAVRVIRAARAVLARGYEGEARAHDRILVELQAHRRAILDDLTGGEALAWTRRERTRNISKRVAAMGDEDLYANLCVDSHGDPLPALILREGDDLNLSPHRTAATRASLLMYAGFARDQAGLIAHLAKNIDLDGLDELDEVIQSGWRRLAEEASGPTRPLGRDAE